jgi:hypothetical protein
MRRADRFNDPPRANEKRFGQIATIVQSADASSKEMADAGPVKPRVPCQLKQPAGFGLAE